MRLHLGCGRHNLEGWLNTDERDDPVHGVRPDQVVDAGTLVGIQLMSCDVIYASHLLEHFHRAQVVEILSTWKSRLKPGGRLWVSVPDKDTLARWHHEAVLAGRANVDWMEKLNSWDYGGQNYSGNYHYVGFNFAYLTDRLNAAGFVNVRRLEHIPIPGLTDYSTMLVAGEPISLNVEAKRSA